jgi:hypothetical protein
MRNYLLSFILILLGVANVGAQRYLTPQFSEVNITSTTYGTNYTVLTVPSVLHTTPQKLDVDIYSPKGDNLASRPLVIYFPTGNFLPHPLNGSPSGTIKDSTCVDIATKLAKLGYVVAVADYRKGWNPVATTQEPRVNTLINAAYRGVQDARTAVRFFREKASTYGIDTARICLWGQGTGGYITLATATLDSYNKVFTTTNPPFKFIGSNQLPYVIEKIPNGVGGVLYINSDIEGKNLGLVPPGSDGKPSAGPPPTGDTLCLPNWVNQSSDFKLAVNMGGALGDISWLDANSKNIISIQAPYDPFAPYKDAVLFVPIPGGQLPVVQVQGSYLVQQKLKTLGKDAPYQKMDPKYDPIGTAIKGKQEGFVNLFPIYGTSTNDSSPWDFWATTNPQHAAGIASNADMTPAKGRRYIDSIIAFVAPRACIGLDLPCRSLVSSSEDVTDAQVGLKLSPNPAKSEINITVADDKPIQAYSVFDISGRMLRSVNSVNASYLNLQREDLQDGIYLVQMQFKEGVLTKKVIFE